MGSVVGCTKKYCLEKNLKELNLDINQNIENLNTVNTNKNDKIKSTLNENEKGDMNKEEEDEKDEEKEEDDENDNENEEEEDDGDEDEDEEGNEEQNDIAKNVLNKKTFKSHKPTIGGKRKIIMQKSATKYVKRKEGQKTGNKMYDRYHTVNYTENKENNLKKNIHKYEYAIYVNDKNKNGNNEKKDDVEDIISVEQPFMQIQSKKSSKLVNNFKSIGMLKGSLVPSVVNLENNKQNNLSKNPHHSQNYLKILNDFGERRKSLLKINDEIARSTNYKYIFGNKEKKEKKDFKIKKNYDNIKGNFMLKNEKVIRYQGGFIKKTKKKNGFGIVTWSDNSTLHGIYTSSAINGIARFYNNKYKSTFIGEYSNNGPKGFGVYHIKSLSLQGYWDISTLNGIAIEVWDDGTYYQGEYQDNKKNGIGLYRWPDGTIYQGEFCNGQMTGKGIIFNSDDSAYSGEMLNGYMNGYGIFSWGNGALYMGYYLQDIKHGFGIYIWDSKVFICYIGFWEMGRQQGIGAKVNGNKIKYCIWNKGKIASTLKGLYEIDRYLTGFQKGYFHFFTTGYIAKLRASSIYNMNAK